MRRLLGRFLSEDGGFAGPEWACAVTILVLVAITGAVVTKHAGGGRTADRPAVVTVR